MLVYCALNCDTAIEADIEDLGCGAGRIPCPECRGTGKSLWPVEMTSLDDVHRCKGTRYELVSV
jgi:hypothetical protein